MCVQSSEGWAKRVDAHTHTRTHITHSHARVRVHTLIRTPVQTDSRMRKQDSLKTSAQIQ